MDLLIIGAILFITMVVIIELLMFAYRNMKVFQAAKMKKRMKKYVFEEDEAGMGIITKRRVMSDIPFLDRLILNTPGILRLDKLLQQANATSPLGFYLLLSCLFGVLGFLIPTVTINTEPMLACFFGIIAAYLPFFHLKQKKEKRIEKFRQQFHEGLDLMARALKSGHAFPTALKLVTTEFDDPLGTECETALHEINFGISVPDALKNLSERIECPEIKYFVIAVVIQRESGGNLAEVLEALAHVIRQKYSFQGKVRVLTAEAKISAVILTLLPFFIAGWIYMTNPEFLAPLVNHPTGRIMLIYAGIMMICGIITMHRMIQIEV